MKDRSIVLIRPTQINLRFASRFSSRHLFHAATPCLSIANCLPFVCHFAHPVRKFTRLSSRLRRPVPRFHRPKVNWNQGDFN
jgi:hypothetical protein